MAGMLSAIKNRWVVDQPQPKTILFGILRGIKFNLNLRNHFQVYLGLNERELFYWFKKLSKKIKTAVDIGGAQGYYTLFFLKKTKAEKVYCFEPDGSCLSELRENLEMNNELASERLQFEPKYFGSTQDDLSNYSAQTLAQNIDYPCLIKMDIEGAEVELLENADALLSQKEVYWILEVHSHHGEKRCRQVFEKHNYNVKKISAAWWRIFLPELRIAENNGWLVAIPRK